MKITDCEMIDNYARYVTHGITLIQSDMFVESTLIKFTPGGLEKIIAMDLEKLDTGFFNLYLGSKLHLSKGTVIRDMTA